MNKLEYLKMYQLEDTHYWFVGKRIFIDTILGNYKKDINSILDIGAGTGGTTRYLEKYGKVTGIETNSYARKLAAKHGIKLVKGSANSLKFKPKSFDLVSMLDVFYHKNVNDEYQTLKKINKLLKKGGYLLITDSALNFLKSSHDKKLHGKRRYAIKTMTKLVESSGFMILRRSYIFTSLFPLVVVKRKLLDIVFPPKESDVTKIPLMINRCILFILKIEAYILKYVSFYIGSSIIVLAKKK